MFKRILTLSLVSFFSISLFGCSLFNKSKDSSVKKDLSYYNQVWEDAFKYNQNTATNLPAKWVFDFEITSAIEWDWNKFKEVFKNFWTQNLKWDFSNITLKLVWDYDFST